VQKKTPKSVKLVEDYLEKILDRGHHKFYKINLDLSPEQMEEWHRGNAPEINQMVNTGHALITEHYEWDKYLKGRGQKGTLELIERDIEMYHVMEHLRTEHGSIEKAIKALEKDSHSNFGKYSLFNKLINKDKPYALYDQLKSIHKAYSRIFRFVRKPVKNGSGKVVSWIKEDPHLNFPMREGAAYALREMKVIWSRYPINKPTGIIEGIHKLLDLPFEEDIEKEVSLYQSIRRNSFGLTYFQPLKLRVQSMGSFSKRFDNRAEKIKAAIKYAENKYDINSNHLKEIYRHYRLIEAEINGHDRGRIVQRLQEDLKN
jgi:hypothetical protein